MFARRNYPSRVCSISSFVHSLDAAVAEARLCVGDLMFLAIGVGAFVLLAMYVLACGRA
jgi:hypothetical protein